MLQSVRLDRDMIGSQVNALAGFAFQGELDPRTRRKSVVQRRALHLPSRQQIICDGRERIIRIKRPKVKAATVGLHKDCVS